MVALAPSVLFVPPAVTEDVVPVAGSIMVGGLDPPDTVPVEKF